MVFESKSMKLGAAVAILLAGVTGGVYFMYKNDQKNAESKSKENSLLDNNSSVMENSKAKKETAPLLSKSEAAPVKTEEDFRDKLAANGLENITENIVQNPEMRDLAKNFIDATKEAIDGKPKVNSYESIVEKVKAKLEAEKSMPVMSMQAIILSHDALVELSSEEFGQLVTKNRNLRRQVKETDLAKYAQYVTEGAQDLEMLIQQNIMKVLADCSITMALYEQSNNYWSQMNPQFALLSMMVIEKMKIMIPTTRDLSNLKVENVIEILKYQLENYRNISLPSVHPEMIPMLKQSFLGDMVFDKFNLEEEDYVKVKGLEQNKEFAMLAQQLQFMIQMDAQAMAGGMPGGMQMPQMGY